MSSSEKEFKLFVGGLNVKTDDETFKAHFEQFGNIVAQDTKVMKDPGTDRSRGFGFVVFESKEDCDRCLETKDHQIDERIVEVKVAVPKGSSPMPRKNRVKKIFLGGISPETTDHDIREALERVCGEGCVSEAKVMTEKGTEKPRGFAFAHLKDCRYTTDDKEYDEAAYDVVDKLLRNNKFIKIRDRDVEVKAAVSQEDMKRENEAKAPRGSFSNYGGLSNYGYGGGREPTPYMYPRGMYDPAVAASAYYGGSYGYPAQQRGTAGRDYMSGYSSMYDRASASGYGYDSSALDYSKYYNQLGMMGSYPSSQSSYGPTRAYSGGEYKSDRSDRGDSSRANFHPYRR